MTMYLKKIETRIEIRATTRAEKFRAKAGEAAAAGDRALKFKKKFEVKKEVRDKFLQKWKKTAIDGLNEAIQFMVDKELDRIEATIKPDVHKAPLTFPEKDLTDYFSQIMINDLKVDYEHMFLEGETYNLTVSDFFKGIKFPDYIAQKVIEILLKEGFKISVLGKPVTDTTHLPMEALWKISVEW